MTNTVQDMSRSMCCGIMRESLFLIIQQCLSKAAHTCPGYWNASNGYYLPKGGSSRTGLSLSFSCRLVLQLTFASFSVMFISLALVLMINEGFQINVSLVI